MFQNVFIFALLFVSVGVYGSTVADKATGYKPKAKDAHVMKKLTQTLFHKNIQAKHQTPLSDIKAGKIKSLQRDPTELVKPKIEAAPKATLRGASAHAGKVDTESLTTTKTRLLSPNKGFVEYTFYEDSSCSTPLSSSGSAVNYCYYDEETGGASAEVAVLKKFPAGYYDIVVHSFGFTDSSCTSLNTTSTVTEDINAWRAYCYTTTDDSGSTIGFKYDHTTSPTNATSDSTFSYYEYKTEAACNNWNSNGIASYGSATSEMFGCSEYFNDGEYFKLSCSNSVVTAEIYSDDSCTTFLRNDDFSDMCSSPYFTYPSRIICESSV
jgi:hypothetical protein